MNRSMVDAAIWSLSLGITPVVVDGKKPRGNGWQTIRYTAEQAKRRFSQRVNMGWNLGEGSQRPVVDVDLDWLEAGELGPRFLHGTWAFGRQNKPNSHHIFECAGAVTEQFRDPLTTGEGAMIVELRATPRSNLGKGIGGSQTVVPPSIHVSGEPIEWNADLCDAHELPTVVDARDLRTRVALLAEACLLKRYAKPDEFEKWIAGDKAIYPTVPTRVLAQILEWRGHKPGPSSPFRSARSDPMTKIEAGGRRPRLMSEAGVLRRRGWNEEEIFSALLARNANSCVPPLAEADIRKLAKGVCRYPAGASR